MDTNSLITVLLGFGFVVAFLFATYAVLIGVSWIIAVIRVVVNNNLLSVKKILWILGSVIFPVVPMFYFVIVERNGFLRLCGWFMILFSAVFLAGAGYIGYKASQTIFSPPAMEDTLPPDAPVIDIKHPTILFTPVQAEPPPAAPDKTVVKKPSAPRKFRWHLTAEENATMMDGSAALLTVKMEPDPAKKARAFQDGLQSLNVVLASNPRNAEALTVRGMLKDAMQSGQGTQDLNAAVAIITQAIGIYPDIPELYAARARALGAVNKDMEARMDLEKAIAIDPLNEDYQRSIKILEAKTAR